MARPPWGVCCGSWKHPVHCIFVFAPILTVRTCQIPQQIVFQWSFYPGKRFPGLASFEMQRPTNQITINVTMMNTAVTSILLLLLISSSITTITNWILFWQSTSASRTKTLSTQFFHFLQKIHPSPTDQRLAFSTSMATRSFRAGKLRKFPVESSDSLLVGW